MSKADEWFKKWRKEGKHLPPFMRDFHDQKDLFKYLQGIVSKKRNEDDQADLGNWISNHIYVVDYFLWIMAAHGWTLQRYARKGVRFPEITDSVEAYTKKCHDAFHQALNEELKARREAREEAQ